MFRCIISKPRELNFAENCIKDRKGEAELLEITDWKNMAVEEKTTFGSSAQQLEANLGPDPWKIPLRLTNPNRPEIANKTLADALRETEIVTFTLSDSRTISKNSNSACDGQCFESSFHKKKTLEPKTKRKTSIEFRSKDEINQEFKALLKKMDDLWLKCMIGMSVDDKPEPDDSFLGFRKISQRHRAKHYMHSYSSSSSDSWSWSSFPEEDLKDEEEESSNKPSSGKEASDGGEIAGHERPNLGFGKRVRRWLTEKRLKFQVPKSKADQ